MSVNRYNDYYLVNDEDVDIEDSVELRPQKRCNTRRVMCTLLIGFFVVAVVTFIFVFVVFPLIFKYNVSLQQNLVFTHWNLETQRIYFEEYRFPGLKNHYVTVSDIDNSTEELHLGLWHILPLELAEISIKESSFDYDAALKNSNYSVLLYFHGTGEDRSQTQRKYQLLRYFFHVIAFDYRSYGDSSKGELFERNVVNDCVQVYKWVQNRTNSRIFVWGHSLGTALATSTIAHLKGNANTTGLILESPFTTFREELYHHPYVKFFKWLPWFESTVINPLEKNGFIFNTSRHILDVACPIMFFHAKDDGIVPYFMSEKLYNISGERKVSETIKNDTVLVLFDRKLDLEHFFIYQDPYLIFYIYDFLKKTSNDTLNFYEGSHQS